MSSENPDPRESLLTTEDYVKYIRVDFKWTLAMFGVIFLILSALLFWFGRSMRRHSNMRVAEATYILDRADTVSAEITPTTLELEEMVVEVAQERDWLFEQMSMDGRAEEIDAELEQRFLDQSFHFELPDDWREQIPPQLQEWHDGELDQRRAEVAALYSELVNFAERNLERQQRADELLEELDPGEEFSETLDRYEAHRSNYIAALEQLKSQAETAAADAGEEPRLASSVYDAMLELPNLLNRTQLQYRRLSALTSAPPAYFYAERYLRDALRIDPRNPEAKYQLGRVYDYLDLDEVSGEHYARAIKADPGYERAGEIIEMFEQRVEESPEDSRASYDLAFALHEYGEEDRAREQLYKVLNLEEDRHSMVKVLAEKRLGYIRGEATMYNQLTYY